MDLDHGCEVHEVVQLGLGSVPGDSRMGEDPPAERPVGDRPDGGRQIEPVDMNDHFRAGIHVGEPIPTPGSPGDDEAAIDVEPPDLDPPWKPALAPERRQADRALRRETIKVEVTIGIHEQTVPASEPDVQAGSGASRRSAIAIEPRPTTLPEDRKGESAPSDSATTTRSSPSCNLKPSGTFRWA